MGLICVLLIVSSVRDVLCILVKLDQHCFVAPCVWAPGHNAPWIQFLISVPYILFACLYHMLPHLSFFLHFFRTYLLPLSFHLRIGMLRFQAGCHKRRLNLAFFVFVLFLLIGECVHLSCYRLQCFDTVGLAAGRASGL